MRNHYQIGLVALPWYQTVWILKKQSVFPQKLKKESKLKMLRGVWPDGLASNSWVKAAHFQTMLTQNWARWQMASSETWDNSHDKGRGWMAGKTGFWPWNASATCLKEPLPARNSLSLNFLGKSCSYTQRNKMTAGYDHTVSGSF